MAQRISRALSNGLALPLRNGCHYRLCADGRHVEPDPAEQAMLDDIRQPRRSGKTLRGIAAALKHRALKTRHGSAWRLEHVARVLKQAAR